MKTVVFDKIELFWGEVYGLLAFGSKKSIVVIVNDLSRRYFKKFNRHPAVAYVNCGRLLKRAFAGTEEHPIEIIPTDAVGYDYAVLGDPDVEWEDRYLT